MSSQRNQNKPSLTRILATLAVAGLAFLAQRTGLLDGLTGSGTEVNGSAATSEAASGSARALFEAERSGVMIAVEGVVHRVLADDLEGSRHQKFLIRQPDGHTLLVAHNIDLAPRVPLEEGDDVRLYGQYEYNPQGGVLHWTHHDPGGRHEEGWIEHAGRRYE